MADDGRQEHPNDSLNVEYRWADADGGCYFVSRAGQRWANGWQVYWKKLDGAASHAAFQTATRRLQVVPRPSRSSASYIYLLQERPDFEMRTPHVEYIVGQEEVRWKLSIAVCARCHSCRAPIPAREAPDLPRMEWCSGGHAWELYPEGCPPSFDSPYWQSWWVRRRVSIDVLRPRLERIEAELLRRLQAMRFSATQRRNYAERYGLPLGEKGQILWEHVGPPSREEAIEAIRAEWGSRLDFLKKTVGVEHRIYKQHATHHDKLVAFRDAFRSIADIQLTLNTDSAAEAADAGLDMVAPLLRLVADDRESWDRVFNKRQADVASHNRGRISPRKMLICELVLHLESIGEFASTERVRQALLGEGSPFPDEVRDKLASSSLVLDETVAEMDSDGKLCFRFRNRADPKPITLGTLDNIVRQVQAKKRSRKAGTRPRKAGKL